MSFRKARRNARLGMNYGLALEVDREGETWAQAIMRGAAIVAAQEAEQARLEALKIPGLTIEPNAGVIKIEVSDGY